MSDIEAPYPPDLQGSGEVVIAERLFEDGLKDQQATFLNSNPKLTLTLTPTPTLTLTQNIAGMQSQMLGPLSVCEGPV